MSRRKCSEMVAFYKESVVTRYRRPCTVFIYLDGLPDNCRTVVSIEEKCTYEFKILLLVLAVK